MKHWFDFSCTFIFLGFMLACQPIGKRDVKDCPVKGKWKMVEAYISAGGPQYWTKIEDGEEIDFFCDNTFVIDGDQDCKSGIFSIDRQILVLEYTCEGYTDALANEQGMIVYDFVVSADELVLTPTQNRCIEGCSFKYRSVN